MHDRREDHRHRVGREVIPILRNRHLVRRSRKCASRVTLIGETDGGRLLEISLDPTAVEGTWRLVTAFDAGSGARRQFELRGR